MPDDSPENVPLKLNAALLSSIREAAQSVLEIPADTSADTTEWPRLPDESYTPEEFSAAYGDAAEYEDQKAFNDPGANIDPPPNELSPHLAAPEDFATTLDFQHAELQRQALRLQALERRAEEEFPTSTLA